MHKRGVRRELRQPGGQERGDELGGQYGPASPSAILPRSNTPSVTAGL